MVNQNAEPTPRIGLELGDDADQVVHPAEVLDDDTLDSQVVAPDLRDEFGIVATLDIAPGGACNPGARAGHRDPAGRRARRGDGRRTARWGEDHRAAVEQIPRAQ